MQNYHRSVLQGADSVSRGVLRLTQPQAAALNLSDKNSTYLYAGKNRMQIIISISESNKNTNHFYLSSSDLKKLRLPAGISLGVSRQPDGIHLGPVVGVMAEKYQQAGRPFGTQSFFIRQLIEAAQELGEFCFGFSPSGVNWTNNTITGYTWNKKRWVKGVFPMPDVVYPREKGYLPYNLKVRKRLQSQGCKFLNPGLIGKWQTYQILSQHPVLKNHLPDTRLVQDFRRVERMINKYRSVYMKPIAGSMGRNIIKVRKTGPNSFHYQYQMNNRMYRGNASGLNQLKNALKPVMRNKAYIVQKQINLLRYHGNLLDVRVMMQKDNTGRFCITGKACRIGRPGSITSNISTGGQGQKVEFILSQHFAQHKQREKIINEINMVAVEAANTLDKAVGSIGELGIDIGIDRDGMIWFIEANLRPARQVFLLIGEKATRKASVTNPMLYCRYLAGFEEK
jgi:hypothetical protein